MLEGLRNKILGIMNECDESLVQFQIYSEDEIYVLLYDEEIALEIDLQNRCVSLSGDYSNYRLRPNKIRDIHKITEYLEDNLSVFYSAIRQAA